ncbi:MAG: right-handed parallel beta-helix repeat-containing protein [Phycisphaerae bacterium]|jgi:hypothetical protein|nr:right-handed parallel beta-helix repeat-containing protein [Phycisphaerae bacterium]
MRRTPSTYLTHSTAPSTDARRADRSITTAPWPLAICLALALSQAALGATRYVRANQILPINQQNGLSWETAFQKLQDGIDACSAGDELRVANGLYLPTTGTDRSASFVLKQGVKLRGGYIGSGPNPDGRSLANSNTRLSGEIGSSSTADNSFHVVRAIGVDSTTLLDGVVISGGNANGVGDDSNGGGILMINSSPHLVRCQFIDNAAKKGGGIARLSGTTTSSVLPIHGCIFADNIAQAGSAIFAQSAPIQLANATVADNSEGSAIDLSNISATSSFSSSILYRNTGQATPELSQFRLTSAALTVSRCCIEGWDNVNPSSATTIGNDPQFAVPQSSNNVPFRLQLGNGSPCIDQGECIAADTADTDGDGNTAEPLPLTIDDAPRIVDDQFFANGGAASNPNTDMGADELVRPRIILVDAAAQGANNGTTWGNAYTSLQSALAELAAPGTGGPGQVWVAKGTYKPTTGTDVNATFLLTDGVHVLGGFAGGEALLSARDWVAHRTILSGELGPAGPTGNSRHVVTCGAGTTSLDGLVIRDGNASSILGGGGIMVDAEAQTTITHCVITANTGIGPGSAIRVEPGDGNLLALGFSIVAGNTAIGTGIAGIVIDGADEVIIDRCLIAGNVSSGSGLAAGIRVQALSAGDVVEISNSILTDNSSGGVHSLAAQCSLGSQAEVRFSAIESFSGTIPNTNPVGCVAVGPDGELIDARGPDRVYGTGDEDYRPLPCSVLIDGGESPEVQEPSGVDLNEIVLNVGLADFLDQTASVNLPIVGANQVGGGDIGPVEAQLLGATGADLDGSGHVDAADLAMLLGAWNSVGSEFDLNGDCLVDASDLAVLLGAWG